jgi:putative transposase
MRHTPLMRTSVSLYHRHRFPAEIISHCVSVYFRFALSFRDVEEMLAMRGVSLSYETVRLSASSSVRFTLTAYVTSLLGLATRGTSTKCS